MPLTLAVTQTLQQTADGVVAKAPKTAKGRRLVVLPSFAVEVLRQHRIAQADSRLLMGSDYIDHGLVFPGQDGSPWPPDSFSSTFASWGRRSAFKIRLHDLRHTHASHLLKEGIHPKVVSERLGHATIAITLDTYSHLLPGLQEEAARRVDAALRDALLNRLGPVDGEV